ncbi:hypothetical protein FAY30_26260 (plasmid) [Bacillus sp. S3]|uniref:hypothetical protein n=1 Tax=Bacillus sp. S3 TaxID=486398 RepID=UPI00118D3D50|nr:hypothetical protein [Bacillus sp. S3]QCJ45451.1 hypothetical protein FAY30_26260 [Bacillus sp. S3]
MSESKKIDFKNQFNRNHKLLIQMIKKQGQFIKLSSELGYLYLVEVGVHAGQAISPEVGLKAGKLNIIDVVPAAL